MRAVQAEAAQREAERLRAQLAAQDRTVHAARADAAAALENAAHARALAEEARKELAATEDALRSHMQMAEAGHQQQAAEWRKAEAAYQVGCQRGRPPLRDAG